MTGLSCDLSLPWRAGAADDLHRISNRMRRRELQQQYCDRYVQSNDSHAECFADDSFTATVSGTSNTAVTWSVNGVANGNDTYGTITASGGQYTAPATITTTVTETITATAAADTTKTAIRFGYANPECECDFTVCNRLTGFCDSSLPAGNRRLPRR